MIKYFIGIVLFGFLFLSCRNEKTATTASISGTFPALTNSMIYLEELEVHKVISLDSCLSDDQGKFNFTFSIDEAGFYIIRTSSKNTIILQLNKNEEVNLFSKLDHFGWKYEVEGSPGSSLLQQFEKFVAHEKMRIDSLGLVYNSVRGTEEFLTVKEQLDSVYQSIVKGHREYVFRFLDSHPKSLATLLVVNRSLGQTRVIDNEEKDYIKLLQLDSSLNLAYPSNKHVQDHHKRLQEIKSKIYDNYVAEEKLSPGRKAPDIVLSDTLGNLFSVKSYTGHPVLVYFWAGWNAPSRRDNQLLKNQYGFLHEKGIQILGVSLDENAIVWKGALKLDQMPWQQVSDLRGMESPIRNEFHIPNDLPYYYVLDENLKIVYKNASLDSVLVRMDGLFF